VQSLRPPDQADLFSELPAIEQVYLLPLLNVENSADILEELKDDQAAEVALRLETEELARLLAEIPLDPTRKPPAWGLRRHELQFPKLVLIFVDQVFGPIEFQGM
jgi:hypothetical protein